MPYLYISKITWGSVEQSVIIISIIINKYELQMLNLQKIFLFKYKGSDG
jgi:hypothetical protein